MTLEEAIGECTQEELDALEAGRQWVESLFEDEIMLYFLPVELVLH